MSTNTVQTQAKAIVAGILTTLLAGASSLATVLTGNATLSTVTTAQWLAVFIAMVTAGGSVYGITWSVTNAPPKVATQSADGSYNVTALPVLTGSITPTGPLVPGPVDVPAPTDPAPAANVEHVDPQ